MINRMQHNCGISEIKSFYSVLAATCAAFLSILTPLYSAPANPGQNEFLYAQRLFDEKYYDLAAEQFERCLRDFPNIVNADEAQYYLAESQFRAGDFEKARSAYLKTAIIYPESPHAPEALFKVGLALEELKREPEAAQAYERVHGFYAQDSYALDGLYKAMVLYSSIGDSIHAESAISRLLEEYPGSERADAARLYKINRLIERGDRQTARQFLEWLSQRSGNDSIAAVAWIRLSDLLRSSWELDAAETALNNAIARFPNTLTSEHAMLKLADLLNYRGKTEEALEILKPLLKSERNESVANALEKTGDAWYKRGKYTQAGAFYDKAVKNNPEAALKAAWCEEMSGDLEAALKRYSSIVEKGISSDENVKIRTAIIYSKLGNYEKAFETWNSVLNSGSFIDSTGRVYYELIRSATRAGKKIEPDIAPTLKSLSESPWLDEIIYNLYISKFLPRTRTDKPIKIKAIEFCEAIKASALYDSTIAVEDYVRRQLIQSPDLVDLMATLSSRPPGSVSKAKWALDWGYFYLENFKDPVKALDQFSIAMEDTSINPQERFRIYSGSVRSYLRLYEQAIREQDKFTMEMYGDSCRNYLSDPVINEWLASDALVFPENTREFKALELEFDRLESIRRQASGQNPGKFPGYATGSVLTGTKHINDEAFYWQELASDPGIDSISVDSLISQLELKIGNISDNRYKARYFLFKLNAYDLDGFHEHADSIAGYIIDRYPDTPSTVEAVQWKINYGRIPAAERYDLLQWLKTEYPYVIDPVKTNLLASNLLDSLRKPMESLSAFEKSLHDANWGTPDLDILTSPNPEHRLKTGYALFKSGSLHRAADELRSLLNLEPQGKFAPQALLLLSLVKYSEREFDIALSYLDTLNIRFKQSEEIDRGRHLRPRVLMDLERYQPAYNDWKQLALSSEIPDSQMYFESRAIICQYRLNNLEGARLEAKDLYKRFEDSFDVDPYKAHFYLEKGMALDRLGSHDKARKQFDIIIESYPSTEWGDDAAYATALSFMSEKNSEEALAAFNRFIEDYPGSDLLPQVLLTSGSMLYREEKYAEAAGMLKQLWECENNDHLRTEAFLALIAVYRDLRFWDAAIRLTREYLKLEPEAQDVIDRKMDLGWYYLQLGEWNEAIRQYEALLPLADAEREAEVQYYIGEANFANGDFQTAILEFLKVKILGRKTKLDWGVTALYKAGLAYEKLGDNEGAARMYRRIIKERGEASNYGRTARQRLDELEE